MDFENMQLESCPYCGRPAKFIVGKEIGDTTRLHTIECGWMHCLKIQTSLSGWSPDCKKQIDSLVNDWNLICKTIANKQQEG